MVKNPLFNKLTKKLEFFHGNFMEWNKMNQNTEINEIIQKDVKKDDKNKSKKNNILDFTSVFINYGNKFS